MSERLISSESSHIYKITKYIKTNYCQPPLTLSTAEQKFQKEQNCGVALLIIGMFPMFTLMFCFGFDPLIEYFQLVSLLLILTYLLKTKKYHKINIIVATASFLIPLLWCYDKDFKSKIPEIQIMLNHNIIYSFLITRSAVYTSIPLIFNMIIQFFIFNPKLKDIFNFTHNDPRALILDQLAIYHTIFNIVLLGITYIISISRNKLVIKLYVQKEKLIEQKLSLSDNVKKKKAIFLTISHDIKNPLNVINGSIELLLMKNNFNQDIMNYFKNTKFSVEFLIFLANNLLDAAKMENSELEVNPSPINTKEFLERLWGSSCILIAKKNLHGCLFVAKNIPDKLKLDFMRIRQVIYNLVGNSIKFTQKGYVYIICSWYQENILNNHMKQPTKEKIFRNNMKRISLRESIRTENLKRKLIKTDLQQEEINKAQIDNRFIDDSGIINTLTKLNAMENFYKFDLEAPSFDFIASRASQDDKKTPEKIGYLKIEVTDSGTGIPPDELSKLFKQFSQLGSNSEKQLGTGLGLWISQHLCHKMGGTLEAFSDGKNGSSFVSTFKCLAS